MSEKILCVDDEINILRAFQRQFRGRFTTEVAAHAEQALQIIHEKGPFSVVVSDMRMPGMDGIELLARVKEIAPQTVRIMLTGESDQRTAMAAVNEGNIFRFLTKPCPVEVLSKAVHDAIDQYHLVMTEKVLLEKTLSGSVKVLTDMLALASPEAFSRASRIRHYVSQLAAHLKAPDVWCYELAAMLSQIGWVTLPASLRDRFYSGQTLSAEERRLVESHPRVGSELIRNIPRLEEIAQMVACQEKHYDGSGFPIDSQKGDIIPFGSRLMKPAIDLVGLESTGLSADEALRELWKRSQWYDPDILAALEVVLGRQGDWQLKRLTLQQLQPGMRFAENVSTQSGLLLTQEGQEVTWALIQKLENFARVSGVAEPVRVYVMNSFSSGASACHWGDAA